MGTATHLVQLLRMSWALLLGNVVEWYEFAVFGLLEPYLEEKFFRGSAVATWLGFAVTFLARPLGGLILGRLGDTFGRRRAVNISILMMLVGTCGQGMLPTYASGSPALGHVGLALLVCLRFLQGISAAGEVSMVATYILEVGPHRTLCRGAAILAMTGQFGWLTAKLVIYILESSLSMEAMRHWGWRVPFVFALLPGLIAVWGRRWLPETELFLEEQRRRQQVEEARRQRSEVATQDVEATGNRTTTTSPRTVHFPSGDGAVWAVLALHGANVLIGIFGVAAMAVHAYGGMVWTQSYLQKHGLSPGGRLLTDLCGRGIMVLLALPVGWLGDVQGVGWVTFAGSSLVAVAGLPLFAVLATHAMDLTVVVVAMGVGLGTMGAVVGTIAFLFVAELFPTQVRAMAVGICYNVGVCMFGGLSPLAFQASLALSPLGPGVLLSLSGAVSAIAVVVGVHLHRRGVVQVAHVRPTPYFCPLDLPEPHAVLPKKKVSVAVDTEQTSEDTSSSANDEQASNIPEASGSEVA